MATDRFGPTVERKTMNIAKFIIITFCPAAAEAVAVYGYQSSPNAIIPTVHEEVVHRAAAPLAQLPPRELHAGGALQPAAATAAAAAAGVGAGVGVTLAAAQAGARALLRPARVGERR